MLVDEGTFDKIKDYEHDDALSDRQRTTLELTDAYLTGSGVDADLRARAIEHFTDAQLIALTLKMANYTSQKMLVALGVDMVFEGRELTDDGFRKSEYENYIDNLRGDRIVLPTAKTER